MFGSRLLWKLYATYVALAAGTAVAIGALVHQRLGSSLLESVDRNLAHHALLLSPYSARHFAGEVPVHEQQSLVRLAREAGVRLTLIAPDGTVVADSEEDPARMANHGDRPEFQAALLRGTGTAQRRSETIADVMRYSARAVLENNATIGVVRVAIPLREVQSQLRAMRLTIVFGAAFGVFAAILLGGLVARRISAPIAEMTEVAEAMRAGDYRRRVRAGARDEFSLLGEALNRLGREVTRQIADLAQQRAQLEAIVAGMVEGVLAVDDGDRVLLCNRAACEMLSAPTDRTVGRRLWELVRLAELPQLLEQARTASPVHEEVVLQRGEPRRVLDVHVTRFEGEQTRGLVIVMHDITDLRHLERIRRDFVANVSHELKTPLTSIKGFVETLLGGALDDPENNVRFLQRIDENVARLTHLVQDLLSLARIEAQQDSLPLQPVECSKILRDVWARHEPGMRRKGLDCRAELGDQPVRVVGDSEAIDQIVDNLLDNAAKYTPAGGRISLGLHRDGRFATIEVSDTGTGIPKHDQDRIFERFYRVDRARSRTLGGTGLGLSIVKHLTQTLGGQVQVESQLGRGSRFTVRLPLAEA